MKDKLVYKGIELTYGADGWLDDITYCCDFGDGQLTDNDGNYFIHVEYHKNEDKWMFEFWYEDENYDNTEVITPDLKVFNEYDRQRFILWIKRNLWMI